jgi:NAD(P)-dependent dehydrogenase (short-subunit alcohol dehydrogenase family)
MRFEGLRSFGTEYRALVIGASGGIGHALCAALRGDEGCVEAVSLSRRDDGFDLLDETSITDHADRLSGQAFDLIICATGALTIGGIGPEKSIRQISPEVMARQFAVNAIGPALVLKHFSPLLPKSTRSVFACLSARVGSIGDNRLGGWISYRASKAALNQIIRTAAIEIGRVRPLATVVAIHPGTVVTALSEPYSGNRDRTAPEIAAGNILRTIDGVTQEKSGGFLAYDGTKIEW